MDILSSVSEIPVDLDEITGKKERGKILENLVLFLGF